MENTLSLQGLTKKATMKIRLWIELEYNFDAAIPMVRAFFSDLRVTVRPLFTPSLLVLIQVTRRGCERWEFDR